MSTRVPSILCALCLLLGCASTGGGGGARPRLVQEAGRWYLAGLDPAAARLATRGTLFRVLRPLARAQGSRAVAVLQSLGAVPEGGAVAVGVRCAVLGETVAPDLEVEPLMAGAEPAVGQCLARTVAEGRDGDTGEPYVVLNVGSGDQVKPGDEFILLGTPVIQDGYVPLGLDTARDGACQVVDRELKLVSARCALTTRPAGDASLLRRFAVFSPRAKETR